MIGLILTAYSFYPTELFRSLERTRHDVRWYIFFHGWDEHLKIELEDFSKQENVVYFPYGINRGLSRSWNEGICRSFADGNHITIILNDDLFFYDGGFDEYIDYIKSQMKHIPNFGLLSVIGMETGPIWDELGTQNAGKSMWQGLACAAIGHAAVDTIGYFDQNFWPAYFEDADYFRRLRLMNVPILTDDRTLVEHNRSATTRIDPELKRLKSLFIKYGEKYYLKKWGGTPGEETFQRPFDDPRFDCYIDTKHLDAPYGSDYDRPDILAPWRSGINDVITIRALDMFYMEAAERRPIDARGSAMWCRASDSDGISILGPNIAVSAGRWGVTFAGKNEGSQADPEIVVDVACENGGKIIRSPGPIGEKGGFEIDLEQDVSDLAIRIYQRTHEFWIKRITLCRIGGS